MGRRPWSSGRGYAGSRFDVKKRKGAWVRRIKFKKNKGKGPVEGRSCSNRTVHIASVHPGTHHMQLFITYLYCSLLAARPRSRSSVGRPMADQARWNCIGIPVHPGILKPPPRCDGDANGNYGIQGCAGRFPRITEYYHEMDERGEQYLEMGPISVVREETP